MSAPAKEPLDARLEYIAELLEGEDVGPGCEIRRVLYEKLVPVGVGTATQRIYVTVVGRAPSGALTAPDVVVGGES